MLEGQPHNVAIAEIFLNGDFGRITGAAATEDDDAIQLILDVMISENLPGDCVTRLYSEREPSEAWKAFIRAQWPNANVTWGVNRDEDADFESYLERAQSESAQKKPWWRFW